jgi:hypothetical protein
LKKPINLIAVPINHHYKKKHLTPWKNNLFPDLEWKVCPMKPECHIIPKSKETVKDYWRPSEGLRDQLHDASTGQRYDSLKANNYQNTTKKLKFMNS